MTGLAEAEAALEAARHRGDTRSIGAAQKAVRRAMTDILRAERDRRREARAAEAKAEAKRERSRRPFWWPFRRRRA